VHRVYLCAAIKEGADDRRVGGEDRESQGVVAVFVDHVRIGAGVEEKANRRLVTIDRRLISGVPRIPGAAVDFGAERIEAFAAAVLPALAADSSAVAPLSSAASIAALGRSRAPARQITRCAARAEFDAAPLDSARPGSSDTYAANAASKASLRSMPIDVVAPSNCCRTYEPHSNTPGGPSFTAVTTEHRTFNIEHRTYECDAPSPLPSPGYW